MRRGGAHHCSAIDERTALKSDDISSDSQKRQTPKVDLDKEKRRGKKCGKKEHAIVCKSGMKRDQSGKIKRNKAGKEWTLWKKGHNEGSISNKLSFKDDESQSPGLNTVGLVHVVSMGCDDGDGAGRTEFVCQGGPLRIWPADHHHVIQVEKEGKSKKREEREKERKREGEKERRREGEKERRRERA
jgi:hypothetical protein